MKRAIIFLGVLVLFSTIRLDAQTTVNSGILDSIQTQFQTNASAWQPRILAYAKFLFGVLATISLVWKLGWLALKRGGGEDILAELIRYIVVIGLLFYFVAQGPTIANAIMYSARDLAESAGSAPNSPSSIIDQGLTLFSNINTLANELNWTKFGNIILLQIIGISILLCFALIAVNMVFLMCAAYIFISAGTLFLGFGGSEWTRDMAFGYFRTTLNISVQIFSMQLIVALGSTMLTDITSNISTGTTTFKGAIIVFIGSFLLLLLSVKVPALLGGIVSGMTHSGSVGSLVNPGDIKKIVPGL